MCTGGNLYGNTGKNTYGSLRCLYRWRIDLLDFLYLTKQE